MGKMKNFLNMVKTYPHVHLSEIEANMGVELGWFYDFCEAEWGSYAWTVGQDGCGWDEMENGSLDPVGNSEHINFCLSILGFCNGDVVYIDFE